MGEAHSRPVQEDIILVSKYDTDSPWHKVVAQLLKISLVETSEGMPVKGKATAGGMMQGIQKIWG